MRDCLGRFAAWALIVVALVGWALVAIVERHCRAK